MRRDPATALRWAGALGIVTIAVMRCVITFAPQVIFDIDPAVDPSPWPGLGPAGSLLLDALLLGACGCGLLGESLSRRGIDWGLLLLAVVPAPIVLWHGLHDTLHLWRGATWLAAVMACVVLAHLGRDRSLRCVLVGLLVAVLVPLVLRGASQSVMFKGSEHAETVAEFEANRDVFFADRGWAADSASALVFERRLRQADPRGWFATTNIFASMMAFGVVLLAGAVVGVGRRRSAWPVWGMALLCAAALAVTGALLMTRSKGAVLAAALGLGFMAIPLLGRRARALLTRFGGTIALLLVGAALVAVYVRGTQLPESWLGERSLLFRWHYLEGAVRVYADHQLTGVGPDGFQAAYMVERNPRSPEEVISAHSMFADWVAMLGGTAVAWVGMVLLLLGRGAERCGDEDDPTPPPVGSRAPLLAAATVAVLGLVPALVIEAADIDGFGKELGRGLGVLGYVAAAAALGLGWQRLPRSAVDWPLACGMTVLVVHGQIEMTFFDPGSVVWVMCILGLAGGAAIKPDHGKASTAVGSGVGLVVAVALLVAAGALAFLRVVPAVRGQQLMNDAAWMLYPPADTLHERVRDRELAADLLTTAYLEHLPGYPILLDEAAKQELIAGQMVEDATALEHVNRAIELAEWAVLDHQRSSSVAVAGEAWWNRAALTGAYEDWTAAIRYAEWLATADPHGIGAWRRYGDVMWDSPRRDESPGPYWWALRNDENFKLDPLKRLSDRDRNEIRRRIEDARR